MVVREKRNVRRQFIWQIWEKIQRIAFAVREQ